MTFCRSAIPAFLCLLFAARLGLTAQIVDQEKVLRTPPAAAAAKGWKVGGLFALNLAQNSLSNWTAGGEDSFAVNLQFNLFANYASEKGSWTNVLDLGYGVLRQERDAAFRKTDDRIDFISKYGRQVIKSFFVAALFGFRSQIKPGYDTVEPVTRQMISRFFSPAYFQLAVGLDFKPDSYLSVFVAPLSSKMTVVGDPVLSAAGSFGVTPGSAAKVEMGGYVRLIFSRSDFKSDALKNVALTSKLDLFTNYLNHPENVDVNWENQLGLIVNKYLSINIHTHLVYDADVLFPSDDGLGDVPKLQFKEIFAIGFSLRF